MKKNNCINSRMKKIIIVLVTFMIILIAIPFVYPIKINGFIVPYEYTIHGTYIEINI